MNPDDAQKAVYAISSLISLAVLWWIAMDLLADWVEGRFVETLKEKVRQREREHTPPSA